MVAVICAMTPRLPPPGGPAHQSAPAHQGAPVHHHRSAPTHQSVSEDSASEDSELGAHTQGVSPPVGQGASDDIELSTRAQTQGVVPPARQSASEDSEQVQGSISPVN